VILRRADQARHRQLDQIERRLTDDDLADWGLVHALVQLEWYRSSMRRTRVRYLVLESGSLLLAGAATVLAALSAPPWLTASVAATVAFLAGLRRVVSWHDDWLAHAEARASAAALIAQYRLLGPAERTPEKRRELVAEIDALVVTETRTWGRRRRERTQPEITAP
jgi:hypothetical protein